MVFYYCEFCNRNVQIRAGSINRCGQCGHFLHSASITLDERRRRIHERTTYCSNCDLLVYTVPIELAINAVNEEKQYDLSIIANPLNSQLYVKDDRFKSDYRLKQEAHTLWSVLCLVILIFIALAIVTGGIALIAIFPLYYFYKKKKKKKQAIILENAHRAQDSVENLIAARSNFRYVCHRCLYGVELNQVPKKKTRKKGSKNKND